MIPIPDRPLLHAALQRDEGLRLVPYRDTVGVLTIGYGRNLEAVGISQAEADTLLDNDIDAAAIVLTEIWPAWRTASVPRQHALLNMAFNLGFRLKQFRRMWAAITTGDWALAADCAMQSKWATQVKGRAVRITQALRHG